MTPKIQQKLLLSKTKPAQLIVSLFGAFLGLVIVMAGFQIYQNIQTLMVQKDMLGGDFIVINKRIGILNTISGTTPSFLEGEKAELTNLKGIDKIGEFTAGNFKSLMEMDPKMVEIAGPGLRTDMFFESVPDEFVDIESDNWKWKQGEPIPIIIPSDYIKLYNMAFAQSQGLPVIPESIIKTVPFKIRLRGQGKEEMLDGRIAGFSQRINSILVPQSFLKWGNENFGDGKTKNPSRLILHTNDPASPALLKFIQDKGYELNEEKLKASKMNGILQIILGIVAFIGALIVTLALLGFMQYNQLLAYRSAYEIQTLHWLGFKVSQLSLPYIKFIITSIIITFTFAVAVLYICQSWFNKFIATKGFEASLPSIWLTLAVGSGIAIIMAIMSSFSSHRQVANLIK